MLREWNLRKIEDAGGWDAWATLPAEDRAARNLANVNAMVRALGEESFNNLDAADQQALTLYVWTGCCMHKDQNSFKGGNVRMQANWKRAYSTYSFGEQVERRRCPQSSLTRARRQAGHGGGDRYLEASAFGGAKVAALAGAIFNNRYDKKGQGDTYIAFMEDQLDAFIKRFPQMNNTRFGSYGEAAGELLERLPLYLKFLEHIRLKKMTPAWTNIELNVYNALKDPATLTELTVLALYQQVITHPYMRMVRRPEGEALNALDLGPLHVQIREHCQKLIDKPELLLDFDRDCHVLASFDGKPWVRPGLVDAIRELDARDELPHLRKMLVAFLEGALVTWIRFSSEYAPGGLIDGMTDAEKEKAYLPATNDRNEGALGFYIVFARNNPSATLQTYNALACFTRNHTQRFVNAFFAAEDHRFVMARTREIDASGMEQLRKQEQADFDRNLAEETEKKLAVKAKRNKEIADRLAAIDLITSVDQIHVKGMTRDRLDDQLEILRRR